MNNKRAFISYAWVGDEHNSWVLKLATRLRSHGVDVILDHWDTRLGDDLAFFMEQGLTSCSLVLCICSDKYNEKANGGIGGAGYEKRIIVSDMINAENKKFVIPIIKDNHLKTKVPTFLSGLKYIDFDSRDYYDCYKELLERIYDEDIKKKPPLGASPFAFSSISDQITTKLNIEETQFHNPDFAGIVTFDYKRNNGVFAIGVGEYAFKTQWSECGNNSIYCYKDNVRRLGYNPDYKEFPSLDEISRFDFSSRAKAVNVGEIVILENHYSKFAAIKITKVVRRAEDINHLLEFEYEIYQGLRGAEL